MSDKPRVAWTHAANAVPCPHCGATDGWCLWWRSQWQDDEEWRFAPVNSRLELCTCHWCRTSERRIYVCAACGECAT